MAKPPATPPASPTGAAELYRRWSRRKAQQRRAQQRPAEPVPLPETRSGEPDCGEAELPSIDALDEHSNLGAFFAESVSESLRRSALRKIFHLQKYNVCDGLDDYAEDYTRFQPLGDIMTADLRLRLEREQLQRALGNAPPAGEPQEPGPERSRTAATEPGEAAAASRDPGEAAAET